MVTRTHDGTPLILALIVFAVGVPWVIGIVWAFRHRLRDGAIPTSMGERGRQRLRSL
jgi:hypothetical protein